MRTLQSAYVRLAKPGGCRDTYLRLVVVQLVRRETQRCVSTPTWFSAHRAIKRAATVTAVAALFIALTSSVQLIYSTAV